MKFSSFSAEALQRASFRHIATSVADNIDERESSGNNSKPAPHQRPEALPSSRMRLVTASVVYIWLLVVESVDAFFYPQTPTVVRHHHQLSPVILYYVKNGKVSSAFPKEKKLDSTLLQSPPPSPSLKNTRTTSGSTEIRKKLVPLSTNPLLFASSDPLLTEQDVEKLRQWCKDNLQPNQTIHPSLFDRGSDELPSLLQRLRDHMDAMVGYDGTGEEVMARYLSYTANPETIDGDNSVSKPCLTTSLLLPDGLHVDTNNGKFFRHWTVLVYLDTCQTSGATTFPLAARLDINESRDTLTEAHHAASHLILTENTLHTRMLKQPGALELGHTIEQAALELYINDNKEDNPTSTWSSTGIRVVPEAGHCCIFSSLMENGSTNPFSIHGGEALLNEDVAKDALTFFYEIPISTFSSREELGKEVTKREAAFLTLHTFRAGQMRDNEDRTQHEKRNL